MLPAQRRALAALPAAVRHYSAAAAAATTAPEVNISTARNGVKVASFNDNAPTAGVAVVVGAGARAEGSEDAGVAHYLKNFGFKNNAKRTAFRITREAEILGGVLSSQLNRESLVFLAEGLKDDVSYFAEVLGDVVSSTKFQEHEFDEVSHQVEIETAYARSTPDIAIVDEAHRVAFHNGLGNSLFAPTTSKIDVAKVKNFAKRIFTSGNIALIGSGIGHDQLTSLAESFAALPSGAAVKSDPSKYYGGESRIEAESDLGHFLLAYEGAAHGTNQFAATQILRYVLGGDKFVKWSPGASPFAQTAAKISADTQISAFNLGYTDNGLFGVYVTAPHKKVTAAVEAATEQLKAISSKISAEDYKRAVAQAKFAAASAFETRVDRLDILGSQALSSGKYVSATDLVAAFDAVKTSDVANVAQNILKSKPTVVALGEIRALPYAGSFSL